MLKRPRIALIAALLAATTLESSERPRPGPTFIGSYVWQGTDPLHGGYSALEMSSDGQSLVAVTDRFGWLQAKIRRNELGVIIAVNPSPIKLLHGLTEPMADDESTDSEGLAISPSGRVYISFEGEAQVLAYDDLGGEPTKLPVPADFLEFPENNGLEALAISPDDTLLTLQEHDPGGSKPFPVYRYRDGQWDQPFNLPKLGDFVPVGADFGPDQRFYILERQFRGFGGFSSQVRSFRFGPNGFSDEKLILRSQVGVHDNLEGLSVWRNQAGEIRLTMISDDNFNIFQTTEIVEYALPDR